VVISASAQPEGWAAPDPATFAGTLGAASHCARADPAVFVRGDESPEAIYECGLLPAPGVHTVEADDPHRNDPRPLEADQQDTIELRNGGQPLTHRLVRLPNVSRRSGRALGGLMGLVIDG
jgi:hypothetical protein